MPVWAWASGRDLDPRFLPTRLHPIPKFWDWEAVCPTGHTAYR